MFSPDKYRSVTWLKGGRVYPELGNIPANSY